MRPEAYVVFGGTEGVQPVLRGFRRAKQILLQTERGPVDALDGINPTNCALSHGVRRLGGVSKSP